MRPASDNILLPVEIQHREFDGKLLLACEIAQRGKGAIIGSRVEIHKKIARLPFKIYHAKDALKSSRRILKIIEESGRLISFLDEEAAVYHTPENYRERRLYSGSLNMIDRIYAWGQDSKKLVEDFGGYTGQHISVTGNPRMDLLRADLRKYHEAHVEELKKEYGEFLLINTNFGKVNHFVKSLSLDVTGKGNTGSDYMKGTHKHRHQVYKAFRDMLPRLAAELGDVPIVLRPHPAENRESWEQILKPFQNVKIIYDGGIIPWLLASKATLHNGCTTAVESFLLGKMAFCYQPLAPSKYDLKLPNDLSDEYTGIDELFTAIRKQVKTGHYRKPTKGQVDLANLYFANLTGPLASEELAEDLIQFMISHETNKTNVLKKISAFLHAEGRAIVKRVNALNVEHKNSAVYTNHRFPGLTLSEVETKVSDFSRILNRFDDVKVTQLEKHIFYLSK